MGNNIGKTLKEKARAFRKGTHISIFRLYIF